jgi:hypothetical protein
MRDALGGRAPVAYGDPTPAEEAEMQRLATRYVRGEVGDDALPTDTLKHIRDCYRALKGVGAALASEARQVRITGVRLSQFCQGRCAI